MKKLLAPALVLVAAGGIAAYIFMNPSILGGGTKPVPASAQPAPVADIVPPAPAPETPPAPQPVVNDAASATPAEAPRPPDAAAPTDNPVELPVTEVVPVPAVPVAQAAAVSAAPTPDIGADVTKTVAAQSNAAAVTPSPEFPDINVKGTPPSAAPTTPVAPSAAAAQGVAAAPVEAVPADVGPDVYYDAGINTPSGPMANAVGPRKVDPTQEPATKFVVVERNEAQSSPEALLVSANRALKLGRYDAAAEMFDQLYAKNKRDPRILMGRAVAYQNLGRNDTALLAYEELLKISPNNEDALLNMLGLLRAQYPEVALRRLMDLRAKYPANAAIAAQIGVMQGELGHTEDALRFLGNAASLEPSNPQHLFNIAVIYDRAGSKDQAVKYYNQALEADTNYSGGQTLPRDQIYDRLSVLRGQ